MPRIPGTQAARWNSSPELALGSRQSTCDPHATPWVALGAVNSEEPTESTAKQKREQKLQRGYVVSKRQPNSPRDSEGQQVEDQSRWCDIVHELSRNTEDGTPLGNSVSRSSGRHGTGEAQRCHWTGQCAWHDLALAPQGHQGLGRVRCLFGSNGRRHLLLPWLIAADLSGPHAVQIDRACGKSWTKNSDLSRTRCPVSGRVGSPSTSSLSWLRGYAKPKTGATNYCHLHGCGKRLRRCQS